MNKIIPTNFKFKEDKSRGTLAEEVSYMAKSAVGKEARRIIWPFPNI